MSTATVEKPTNIDICDICGDEITEEQKSDPEMVATLLPYGANKIKPVNLPDFRIVKFNWPSWGRMLAKREANIPEGEPAYSVKALDSRDPLYERSRNYDFHAECLAGLLDAAVDLRLDREQKRQRAAETLEKRNAKIIAAAERKRG